MKVALFGSTGKSGPAVAAALLARGHKVRAFARRGNGLRRLPPGCERTLADLDTPRDLADSLCDVDAVVSLAPAIYTDVLVDAAPRTLTRYVFIGSTRVFSGLPDPGADAVVRGESALRAAGLPAVVLYSSLIYGAEGERTINRILDLVAHWPGALPLVVPLPGGGRAHLQPVHVEDFAAAVGAAIDLPAPTPSPMIVAGPAPLPYRDVVRACAAALGRRAHVVAVPTGLLAGASGVLRGLGIPFPLAPDEVRRAAEDKTFDIGELEQILGVHPRPFAVGLAETVYRRRTGRMRAGTTG